MRSMDKHLPRDFLPNIVIHNILSICSRIAGRGTRDPKRGLKFSRLISSRMVLIRWAGLGRCMMRSRQWACTGAELIEWWV